METLLNLWYHENCRVFQDRLVNETDRDWFDKLLRNFMQSEFRVDPAKVIGSEFILYGDFCNDSRKYERITDFSKVCSCLSLYWHKI